MEPQGEHPDLSSGFGGGSKWVWDSITNGWIYLELYGWYFLIVVVALACNWPWLGPRVLRWWYSLGAPTAPVHADLNAVNEARLRQQQRLLTDSKDAKERADARRRAQALEAEASGLKPAASQTRKRKPPPPSSFGGGAGGGGGYNPLTGTGGGGGGYRPAPRRTGGG